LPVFPEGVDRAADRDDSPAIFHTNSLDPPARSADDADSGLAARRPRKPRRVVRSNKIGVMGRTKESCKTARYLGPAGGRRVVALSHPRLPSCCASPDSYGQLESISVHIAGRKPKERRAVDPDKGTRTSPEAGTKDQTWKQETAVRDARWGCRQRHKDRALGFSRSSAPTQANAFGRPP
jgi:hypothetical protein